MIKTTSDAIPPTPTKAYLATLSVLGGFTLRDSSGIAFELKARKSRQLLAYLAIPPDQTRSREHLAALLWSDRQDEQARGSLRTALSGIRRAIGDDALIVEHDTVKLRTGHLDTDYNELKRLFENDGHVSKLGDFYSGELLVGHEHDSELFMEWLRGLRAECSDIALKILEKNGERFAKNGDYASAIDLMRECLSLEPLKEQTHRTIMKLYAANGEKAMALAQFRTCKELMLHELETVPDPETQALADSIALSDVTVSEQLRHQAIILPETSIPAQSLDNNSPSIAVLPFVNMSGDAEQSYFADGMTEDVITDLSDIDGLSVAALSISRMYRGSNVPPAQISQEIGVRYILEGSVRKFGEHVRISAHLTDTRSSLQAWSKRYDRQLENIFELQSEISGSIVSALKLKLTSPVDVADKRTTTVVAAYECYQRGQVLMKDGSKSNVYQAISFFKQAIELDPGYALAYTWLSRCATHLVLHYDVDRSLLDEALDNCNTALRLHPELAEAYSARGNAYIFKNELEKARIDLNKAISLAPNLASAHFYMGQYYVNTREGIAEGYNSYKRAFDLSQDLRIGMMAHTCLHGLDRPEELESLSKEILKISQRRFSLNPYDFTALHMMAFSYHDLGDAKKAKHWANVASSLYMEDGAVAYNLACLHSTLGSIDESLAMLEQTLMLGCNELKVRFMKYTDPDLDNVREDPRFDKLLAKFGYNLRSRKRKPIRTKV